MKPVEGTVAEKVPGSVVKPKALNPETGEPLNPSAPKAEKTSADKPANEAPKAKGEKGKESGNKKNTDGKVVVANEKAKKDNKAKKDAKAQKANAKLPATGVVAGSVAGLGVALVAAGSALSFRRRK
ncbi:LPXTG cell wall anchor domain-containing protein [Aerococcus urinae]|nr:LPXTG cell wall anchor domain-containing protein [Aerococcus urinae]